jgi:FAD:protein FMN transferase
MTPAEQPAGWQRRARPLLGTLVEVGLMTRQSSADALLAFDAAFAAVAAVQACLSRFDPVSDIARFNALPENGRLEVQGDTVAVLRLAQELFDQTAGLFDVSLGSASHGWLLEGHRLYKLHRDTRLDLGGIGKGHAVDRAVAAVRQTGVASGWVNAGGDLCTFGAARVPVKLRNEEHGGATDFGVLHDGAFATSRFDAPGHAPLAQPSHAASTARAARHVSVAAASCIWADALTKVVAASGNAAHPSVTRAGASAWLH